MIPISDESQKGFFPFVNYLLIAANIAVYFFIQPSNIEAIRAFFNQFGLIPSQITQSPLEISGYVKIITSMFVHGDFWHLAGNMLYLWIFGDNIEYAIGHKRYLIFYLMVGIGAAVLQVAMNPNSTIPMVGASGAISGVLGAYLLKYPKNKVSILFFFIIIIRIVKIKAVYVLLFWLLFQLYNGYIHMVPGAESGVAWFAHIGGFAAGFILVKLFEIYPKYK